MVVSLLRWRTGKGESTRLLHILNPQSSWVEKMTVKISGRKDSKGFFLIEVWTPIWANFLYSYVVLIPVLPSTCPNSHQRPCFLLFSKSQISAYPKANSEFDQGFPYGFHECKPVHLFIHVFSLRARRIKGMKET